MALRSNAQLLCPTDAHKFEEICRDVLCLIYQEKFPEIPASTLFQLDGVNGQNQHGIDICSIFTEGEANRYVVAQCKNYLHSSSNAFQKAADKDIDRIITELDIPVEEIYIMTSQGRDNKLQKHFARYYRNKKETDPKFPLLHILFWEEISEEIRSSKKLLEKYYPDYIVKVKDDIVIFEDDNMSVYYSWKKKQTEIFKAADQKINDLFEKGKITNSKTNMPENYQIDKIIKSLLSLGIPTEVGFEIAEITTNNIYHHFKDIQKDKRELKTGEIRKVVSLAIQEINNPEYSKEEVEKWTNRYARRYGHNNENLKVYFPSQPGRKEELGYTFIQGEFLDTVIDKIVPNSRAKKEILPKARQYMSEEILSFINQCDLYQINFDLMVSMIVEIATQPPHPWFVSDELRRENLDYNEARIDENMEKLKHEIAAKQKISRSVILEILHHSAALILGTHNYFFGCYDISSVYRLRDILSYFQEKNSVESSKSQGTNPDSLQTEKGKISISWDDAIDRTKLSGLLADLMLSGMSNPETNPRNLYELLRTLETQVTEMGRNNADNWELIENTKKLADYAKQIRRCSTRDEICDFLGNDWSAFTRDEIIKHVITIFSTIFPVLKYKQKLPVNNHFGIRYMIPNVSKFPVNIMKYCLFLIVGLDTGMDIDFLSNLTDPVKKAECNMIVVIAENSEGVTLLTDRVANQLNQLNISGDYHLIGMTKQDLKAVLQAEDKIEWFCEFYQTKTEDEDW